MSKLLNDIFREYTALDHKWILKTHGKNDVLYFKCEDLNGHWATIQSKEWRRLPIGPTVKFDCPCGENHEILEEVYNSAIVPWGMDPNT
jgi:hypothetical protein